MVDSAHTYQVIIVKILNFYFPGATFYLYGSRAQEVATATSDVDIAIDAGMQISVRDIFRAKNAICDYAIPLMVDLIDLQQAPPAVVAYFEKTKVVLFAPQK